jgi:uncharacterized protein YybS (DUF2232 family)
VGTAFAAALLFSAAALPERVPALGPVLGLLALVSPFPLALRRLRGGAGSAMMAAGLAGVLLATVFSPSQALGFLLVLAGPGLLMAEALARGQGLLRGCAWGFGLLAAVIVVALLASGPELAAQVGEPMQRYRSPEFLEQMSSGGLPPERVEDWSEQLRVLHGAWEVVYPAVFLIMGAVLVLANAALLRAYLVRREPRWLVGGEFERFRWPLGMVVVFVAAGAALLAPALRSAAYNVLLFVAFLLALQGLAIVAYFTHRLAGPPLLRTALMIFVLLNPFAPQILALLGLFDTWVDFRKWAEPPKPSEG